MRSKIIFTLLIISVICAGCGRKPQIRELNQNSVVLAFGDSLTFGTGVTTEESYPAVLAEIIGCRVVSKGVPGELTSEGVRRLPHVLEDIKPDLVILCHGGNDMLRKRPQPQTIANLDAMIEMIHKADADVILLGVPRPNLILRTPPFYKDLAEKYNIPFDAKTIPKILSNRALKSDRIHPNSEGYRIMAQAAADLIAKY
jgi:lysophospholipase L1-like esterase